MCTRAPLCTPVHPCTVQVVLHDLAQVVPLLSGAHNQILRKIPSQGLKLRFAYPPISESEHCAMVAIKPIGGFFRNLKLFMKKNSYN